MRIRFFLLSCLAWGTAARVQAQATATTASPSTLVAGAVDSNSIRAHLEFLADDALEGRRPGTRGGELAARYIAAQFQRMGLKPAGDSGTYYHRVPIITLTPHPAVKVVGPAPVPLTFRDDYVLWSMRNDSSVHATGDLVFVGYGIVAPENNWNDYEGTDVKNKIVVALVNDPGLRDSSIFRGPILTYYGRWTYKIEEARRQGAAGILMVHTTESATYPWTTVQSSWTGPQVRIEESPGSLLVAGWLTENAAGRLFKAGGQDLTGLMDQAARRGFRAVPLGMSLDATVRSEIERSATSNVLARYPGRGARSSEVVMIGGHYDHFGIATPVDGDSIYNGAEDNASGTAAVLAAAEAFTRSGVRTSRSIVFAGFTAEESGLLGSQAFVVKPTIPLSQVAAILNLDVMNLYGRTRDASALGLDQSSLGQVFQKAAAAEGLTVSVNRDALLKGSFFRSDHFPFARAGVPGTSMESGESYLNRPADYGQKKSDEYVAKRYHQPSDEVLPSFTYGGAIQQLRVIVRTAVAVANAPAQPVWNKTSEFREAGEARQKVK
ncbi:MAG TPA: M20/M25/M40 family metallo-hydrolase [Gemmatimonadales bacterium]|nr:M20/M25/M40 family metallo-hydrolase [Gemmatimonadales bacterium]